MSDAMNIFVIPDGPIKVSDAESVRFESEALEVSGDVYLCRCGDSKRGPFCDGTHKSAGFSGACERAPAGNVRVWEGQSLRTFFNADACMHVYYCKPLKELRAREEAGDAEAAAEIMKVVGTCPSGALSYEVKSDLPEPAEVSEAVIEIIAGGEIRVRGAFKINAPLLDRMAGDKATLCRCGRSKSKPWCDGRHKGRKDFR